MLLEIFDNVGKYGPVFIFLISIYLLYNKFILVITYVIGYILNILLNSGLKIMFRLPRPNEKNITKFNIELKLNKITNPNRFGMPSGHAQTMIYSLVFVSLALLSNKNKEKGINSSQNWIALMIILSIITIAQRHHFKWHYLTQLFVGSIIGALFGYICFYYSQIRIRGSLNKKSTF